MKQNRHTGKREREARKRSLKKRNVIVISNGSGRLTRKLGSRKYGEYLKKNNYPF